MIIVQLSKATNTVFVRTRHSGYEKLVIIYLFILCFEKLGMKISTYIIVTNYTLN